jgi:hypothetical protein
MGQVINHNARIWRATSTRILPALAVCVLSVLLSACGAGQAARGKDYRPPVLSDSGKSLLVIYRPAQSWRAKAGAWPEVFVDDRSLGILRYKGYITAEVEPGAQRLRLTGLTSASRSWDFRDRDLALSLKPGETYYYEVVVVYDENSNVLGKPGMDYTLQAFPTREEDAKYKLPDMKRSN